MADDRDRDRKPRSGGGGRPQNRGGGKPYRSGSRPSGGRSGQGGSGYRGQSSGGPRRDFDRPRDRDNRDDRPRPDADRSRSYDDRPRRDYGDKPRRDFGDRPRREYGDRPRRDYDRPRSGDRARGVDDRPRSDDRPREPRWEDRPPGRGAAPSGPRRDWQPRGGRPVGRPYTSRPFSERGPRPPRPRDDAAVESGEFLGEEEELIAGRRPVEEAFAARREAIRLLVVPERRAALDQLVIHATTLRIPVVELEGGSLTSLAGFDGHQGIALVAKPRAAADMEQILAVARARSEPPFVLVLDSLEDPQNFGTMLRSAEAVGVHGVIYPTKRSAPLSPSAIKASAGATEHLLMAAAEDLAGVLADLHGRGLRILAAEEDAALDYSEADLRGPLAIVVGSEGRGISASVRRRVDLSVRIPMRGKIASLNAAVAGSILLFAAAQQRPAATTAEAPAATEAPVFADVPTEPAKPKRTRKPKTEAAEAPPEPAKPKRTRKSKTEDVAAVPAKLAKKPKAATSKATRKKAVEPVPPEDELLP